MEDFVLERTSFILDTAMNIHQSCPRPLCTSRVQDVLGDKISGMSEDDLRMCLDMARILRYSVDILSTAMLIQETCPQADDADQVREILGDKVSETPGGVLSASLSIVRILNYQGSELIKEQDHATN